MLDCSPYVSGRLATQADKFGGILSATELSYTDLVVREAIQNSLDAASSDDSRKYVEVQFQAGEFDRDKLQNIFREGEADFSRINDRRKRFLAIRDLYTTGLNGDYWDKKSNFYKLIYGYNTGKDDNDQGAGGSFGLGKTVFIRIGIGVVIYYTRFKKEDSYEERLIVFYCPSTDDSPFRDRLLPEKIGWWGKKIDDPDPDKSFAPLTDSEEIKSILDIFKINPYKDAETGTTIIIPFTNEEKQLEYVKNHDSGRQNQDQDSQKQPPWVQDLRSYLEYAVLKWYAPRILNPDPFEPDAPYPYGKKLICSFRIGDEERGINYTGDVYKAFAKIRKMYTLANDSQKPFDSNIDWDLNAADDEFKKIEIRLNSGEAVDWNRQPVGSLILMRVNQPDYVLTDLCKTAKSVMLYCRQPGMIVRYSINDDWNSAIRAACGQDENSPNVIGLFVVNSKAVVSYRKSEVDWGNIDIDALFRNIELPDHHSWLSETKPHIGNTQLDIQIARRVTDRIKNCLGSDAGQESKESKTADDIGNFLGQFFAAGDQKATSAEGNDPVGNPSSEPTEGRQNSFKKTKIEFHTPEYLVDGDQFIVKVPCKITVCPDMTKITLVLNVMTEQRPYDLEKWKKYFGSEVFPIEILGFDGDDAKQISWTKTDNQIEVTLPARRVVLKDLKLVYSLHRHDVSCSISKEVK